MVDELFSGSQSGLADAVGGRRALVVATPTVHSLFGSRMRQAAHDMGMDLSVHVISSGEAHKNMDSVLSVCAAASRAGLGRRDLLVALGGGVCSDVVTMAANMIRRGLPYLCLPTTVVAQVDAAIGVKGALNFAGKKSYIGCFHPPERVLVDQGLLRTLPAGEVRAGMAEILKVALAKDEQLFDLLAQWGSQLVSSSFMNPVAAGHDVLQRSIGTMLDELGQDCYEQGPLRRLMDFGHTFSPAIEEASGYKVSHGYAVAIDMALTCAIGVQLGLLEASVHHQILETFRLLGLPTGSPLCTPELLIAGMDATCAHRAGALNLVVPVAIGSCVFLAEREIISRDLLESAIQYLGAGGLVEAGRP